jgi:hypothetical protein
MRLGPRPVDQGDNADRNRAFCRVRMRLCRRVLGSTAWTSRSAFSAAACASSRDPTRLAFARLLTGRRTADARHPGRYAVYFDDDRIKTMFDALHRQAGAQQVIVFSRRQPAFVRLGGHALRPRPGNPKTERDTTRPRHVGFRGAAQHRSWRWFDLLRLASAWVAPNALLTNFCPVAMRQPPT